MKNLYLILLFSLVSIGFRLHGQASLSKDIQVEAETYLITGTTAYLLENYDKAINDLKKSKKLNPNASATYYRLAQCYFAKEDLKKSKEYISQAIAINSTVAEYYEYEYNLNKAMLNDEEAIRSLEKLVGNCKNEFVYNENIVDEYINLGTSYYNQLVGIRKSGEMDKNIKKQIIQLKKNYRRCFENALMRLDTLENKQGLDERISKARQWVFSALGEDEKYVEEAIRLSAAFPKSRKHKISIAEIYFEQGKDKQAIAVYENLLKVHPNDSRTKMLLADYYMDNGQTEEAKELYTQVFKDKAIDVTAKKERLNKFILLKENKVYTDYLLKILELTHPDDPDLYLLLGDYYMRQNINDKALLYLNKAIKGNETKLFVWESIAGAYLNSKNYKKVLITIEKAEEYFPNQASLVLYKGIAQAELKQFDEAKSTYERGKRMSGSNKALKIDFLVRLADLYNETKEYKLSDRTFEEVITIDSTNLYALNNYSYYLSLRKENLKRAEELSSLLVAQRPEEAIYLDTYAWVLFQQGKYTEAKVYLEKAVEDIEDADVFEHYGDVLFKLGQTDEALKYWKMAQELDGGSDKLSEKINKKVYVE